LSHLHINEQIQSIYLFVNNILKQTTLMIYELKRKLMVKRYNAIPSGSKEKNNGPNIYTIQSILNYSKSLEVSTGKSRIVICLN